jgi:uncharacterized protein YfaS (alpha-2-macroglobulin family)
MRSLLRLVIIALWVGITASAFAQKKFVREDLASDLVRLEESLRNETRAVTQDHSAQQIRRDALASEAKSDWQAALRGFAAAIVANPKDASNWLGYVRAALQIDRLRNDRPDPTLSNRIAAAAYGAFQRAQNKADEAQALADLGAISARQESWRSALNAYRASIDRVEAPDIRRIYADLLVKYGFRILNYVVDSDSPNARVCFQFSEPLARGNVDFSPFVAVAGMTNRAITTDEQQLCVEGLEHGARYAIVVREGLPSAVGEGLIKSADYEIYVRDRSPQVRFTGRNYVLPRVGQAGLPIVTVNTTVVAIDLYRIGDRSLISAVRSGDFPGQLDAYRARAIADRDGSKLWSGTIDTANELNKDVITAFPILQVLKTVEPGVYVLLARPNSGRDLLGEDDTNLATQWLTISDLGLTSFSSADGIYGLVYSLATAQPRPGIRLQLVARNNEILASQTTDASGRVRFDPGLSRGAGGLAPGLLIASDMAGDYNFLDLTQGAFDLTDRGVKGRPAARSLDAFLYTERGVYRSGEVVYVTALLRDARAVAVTGLPITLVVSRPDGVDYKRVLLEDQGLGGRALVLPLLSDAATGTWRIHAFVDPKGPAIGETSFLVEDYVPERLELTLTSKEKVAKPGGSVAIEVDARYLFGAPGGHLEITGEVIVRPADKPAGGLEGYHFGLEDETFENIENELEQAVTTDDRGHASVAVPIPQIAAAKPLEAKIVLRAGEIGGHAVERVVILPLVPASPILGIRPKFVSLEAGATASFDVVALDPDGNRVSRQRLHWSLYRVENDYQWFRSDGRWNFERVKSTRRIADGVVETGVAAAGQISAAVGWGAHRLEVQSDTAGDQPASISFTNGWSGDATADVPDLAQISLDRTNYQPGDRMRLHIASRFEGTATLAIVSDRIQTFVDSAIQKGDTELTLPVSADWGAGAYAVVLSHRPLDVTEKRMPGRALGLAWFGIDAAAHTLAVFVDAPEKFKPRQTLTLPIRLSGLSPGEEARIAVAAVDLGILNLTQYETPRPADYFFGQRQLATEMRDVYGLLIDGMQGAPGAIRSGGDSGGKTIEGDRPTQEPLSRYSGIVRVGANGQAEVSFDLPAFNGTLRVMAVAWSRNRTGSTSVDVIVRDPIAVQANLPRFANLGDQTQLTLELANVEGPQGNYAVDVNFHGPIAIPAVALHQIVQFDPAGRSVITVPILATGVGVASIDVVLAGPAGAEGQHLSLAIEPGSAALYRRSIRTLAKGESLTLSADLIADFVPGSASIAVDASPLVAIDVAAILQALDHYPYGCSEQIVSRAMPLLYANRLAAHSALAPDATVQETIRGAIDRIMTRQDSNGAFGLWQAGSSDDIWLDGYVTDFLTRARETGFTVPQKGFDTALDHLRNFAANTTEVDADLSDGLAYAVYVLARNGRPVMGDLRYLADAKLAAFQNPLARAQLGAALSLLGDRGRASNVLSSSIDLLQAVKETAVFRSDYGSQLRDGAGILALAAEARLDRAELQKASFILQQAQGVARTTTQENAWLMLAALAIADEAAALRLNVDNQPTQGAFHKVWGGDLLDQLPTTITNTGETPVRIILTSSGHPAEPEPQVAQGYDVERQFYRLDGSKMDGVTAKQGERFVIVVKLTESESRNARLLLVDRLPAGVEIDNPTFVDSGSVAALSFLKKELEPQHSEYRDDRVVVAFDRRSDQPAFLEVAYIVRAVTPGHYIYPPATAEDMYRPERFGRTTSGRFDVTQP